MTDACADPLELALRLEDERIGCMACACRVKRADGRGWQCAGASTDWPEGRKGECPAWTPKGEA